METLKKVLFFYSIIAVTVLFFSLGFSRSFFQSFVLLAVLFPLLAYLWIEMTSPQMVKAEAWSVRFITAVAVFSLIGIAGFQYSKELARRTAALNQQAAEEENVEELKNQIEALKSQAEKNEELVKELSTIKEALLSLKVQGEETSVDDLIERLADVPLGSMVAAEGQEESASVFEEPNFSSKILGRLEKDREYSFFKKEEDWFLVELEEEKRGWVNNSVVEVKSEGEEQGS